MVYVRIITIFFLQLSIFSSVSAGNVSLEYFINGEFKNVRSAYLTEKDVNKATKYLNRKDINIESSLLIIKELFNSFRDKGHHEKVSNLAFLKSIWKETINFDGKKTSQPQLIYNSTLSLLILTLDKGFISDLEYRVLVDQLQFSLNYPVYFGPRKKRRHRDGRRPLIELSEYYEKLNRILSIKQTNRFPESEIFIPLRKMYSKSKVNGEKYTYREKIYAEFTVLQIEAMGELLSKMLHYMNADRLNIVLEYDDHEDIIIEASLMDQYRFALRYYDILKYEYENRESKIGKGVDELDIIFAGLELGIISAKELEVLLINPDFYRPEISFESKLKSYIGDLFILGLQTNPSTAPYVILPLLIYRSFKASEKVPFSVDEDHFFFTLPER